MEGERFDRLAKTLARVGSRRQALRTAVGGLFAVGAVGPAREGAGARCKRGKKRCDGRCRNLKRDDDNCGKCGRRCAPREACVEGKCVESGGGAGGGIGCWEAGAACDENADCCPGLACRYLGFRRVCMYRSIFG